MTVAEDGNATQGPERLVGRIREHLRSANTKVDGGDISGAAQDERCADDHIVQLLNLCMHTMQRYAWTYFPSNDRDGPRDDAISQMTVNIVQAIRDLSPKNELYERRFNLCFKRDCLDAVKSVLRENDYPVDESEEQPAYVLVSADQPLTSWSNDDGEATVGDQIVDTNAGQAILVFARKESTRQEISMLDPTHRRIVEMWLDSVPWSMIISTCGISEKTARKYLKEAAAIVISRIRPEKERGK